MNCDVISPFPLHSSFIQTTILFFIIFLNTGLINAKLRTLEKVPFSIILFAMLYTKGWKKYLHKSFICLVVMPSISEYIDSFENCFFFQYDDGFEIESIFHLLIWDSISYEKNKKHNKRE